MERLNEHPSTTHPQTVINNHHALSKKKDKQHIWTIGALLSPGKEDNNPPIPKSAQIPVLNKHAMSCSSTGCKQITLTGNNGKKSKISIYWTDHGVKIAGNKKIQ